MIFPLAIHGAQKPALHEWLFLTLTLIDALYTEDSDRLSFQKGYVLPATLAESLFPLPS